MVNEKGRLQFQYRLDFIKILPAEVFEQEYVLKSVLKLAVLSRNLK